MPTPQRASFTSENNTAPAEESLGPFSLHLALCGDTQSQSYVVVLSGFHTLIARSL